MCCSITLLSLEKRDEKTLGLDGFGEPGAESDSPPNVDIPQARGLEIPDTGIEKGTRHYKPKLTFPFDRTIISVDPLYSFNFFLFRKASILPAARAPWLPAFVDCFCSFHSITSPAAKMLSCDLSWRVGRTRTKPVSLRESGPRASLTNAVLARGPRAWTCQERGVTCSPRNDISKEYETYDKVNLFEFLSRTSRDPLDFLCLFDVDVVVENELNSPRA